MTRGGGRSRRTAETSISTRAGSHTHAKYRLHEVGRHLADRLYGAEVHRDVDVTVEEALPALAVAPRPVLPSISVAAPSAG